MKNPMNLLRIDSIYVAPQTNPVPVPLPVRSFRAVRGECRVHGIADLSHEFSFYADGRFRSQYLPDQVVLSNWGNLYDLDTENINPDRPAGL